MLHTGAAMGISDCNILIMGRELGDRLISRWVDSERALIMRKGGPENLFGSMGQASIQIVAWLLIYVM